MVDRAVSPAGEERADEPLGFAVGLRAVCASSEVTDAELLAGEGMDDGAVGRPVVGDDALDADPVAGKEGERPAEEADGGGAFLVGEDLDVGESAEVVDGDVDVLPADGITATACRVGVAAVVMRVRPATDTLARSALDPAELFTSMCTSSQGRDRSYRTGCSSPIRPSRPMPCRFKTTETVESGICSVSAISAAVIRSCRNNTITATRSSAVRFATRRGADERSRKPCSPSSR